LTNATREEFFLISGRKSGGGKTGVVKEKIRNLLAVKIRPGGGGCVEKDVQVYVKRSSFHHLRKEGGDRLKSVLVLGGKKEEKRGYLFL